MSAAVPAGVRKASSIGVIHLTQMVKPKEARDFAVGAAREHV
jgi:hypothetical protein